MALVDYERAWVELTAHVASKPHHGSRDLALKMMELVARNAEDESFVERAFRAYGIQLHEDLRAAARQEPVVTALDPREHPPDLSRGSSSVADAGVPAHPTIQEDHDGRRPAHHSQYCRSG